VDLPTQKTTLKKGDERIKFIQTNNLQDCKSFPTKMKVITYPKLTKVYTWKGHYVCDTESISMDIDDIINTKCKDGNKVPNEEDGTGNKPDISNIECEEEKEV
jgi:hypothetical protein